MRVQITGVFTIVMSDGRQISFEPGIQVVDADVAEHWAFKAQAVMLDEVKETSNAKKQSSTK